MDMYRKALGVAFSRDLAGIGGFATPRQLSALEQATKAMSGAEAMRRIWEKQAALEKVLGGPAGLMTDINDRLTRGYAPDSFAGQLISGKLALHSRVQELTTWTRLQSQLDRVLAANKLVDESLGFASKYAMLGASNVGKNVFQVWDDRFDSLRAIAASAQTVPWMTPLVPAMLSLTDLADEDLEEKDRIARIRDIVATFLASTPRHVNLDRLMAIFGVILALLPNSPIEEMSEEMRVGFQALREEIRANRVAEELDAEQLRELQVQILLAKEGVEAGYVATIETATRIKTRRSGRASVLGALSPGEPVIVLLLRGRWAYIEAELETRHVVGWIPKKTLSRPRRALLPDLAGAAGATNEEQ